MKRLKPNYIVIPLIVLLTSATGSMATSSGVNTWYQTLTLPEIAPPGAYIGMVWALIYFMMTVFALIVWNRFKRDNNFYTIVILLLLNAILNSLWSVIFFRLNDIKGALMEMVLLNATNLLLIGLAWKQSKRAALLVVPYFLWVCFATYLTYMIWTLN